MYKPRMITPDQLRAARGLIKWSREELANAAGVSAIAIKLYELGQSDPRTSTLLKLRSAFSKEGVVFLEPNNAHGVGVAFRNDYEPRKRRASAPKKT